MASKAELALGEEFLKLYVAYKVETNFVDIVPQAKRLKLALNMRFSAVNAPKGLCKDVTDIGRWGNGDVEVGLASLDELPYVLGLVRQSKLMQGLADKDFGQDKLLAMQQLVDAEKSDLFDVLAYVAYAMPPVTRWACTCKKAWQVARLCGALNYLDLPL